MRICLICLLSLVLFGCEAAQNQITLRPPTGQAAIRFGTDRTGTVNFHLWRLGAALDAEHEKAGQFAERLRKLEAALLFDPNEWQLLNERLKLIEGKLDNLSADPNNFLLF